MLEYNQKSRFDKISLSFAPKGFVLDVGCGNGRFISNAPERIWGIDSSPQAISECTAKKYNVIQAIIPQIPFPTSTFAMVNCSHIIEHLSPSELHKLLLEVNRVLVPGGILSIQAPLLHNHFYDDLTHIRPYTPESIIHYLVKQSIASDQQHTLSSISNNYTLQLLKYRYSKLMRFPISYPRLLNRLFNYLLKFNIHGFKKTGYLLILRKGDESSEV